MMKKESKIGLGTAAIGRPSYINIRDGSSRNEFSYDTFYRQGIDMLEYAYEKGIRYYDTAPGYGIAEKMILNWKKEKEDVEIEIATKWGYTYIGNLHPNDTEHELKEHSILKLNEQWKQSKALMPQLTTYQIHSATFETGVLENKEILQRLLELKDAHDLKIGITTTGANQVEVLKRALDIEIEGRNIFDTFQVTYNVFDQSLKSIASEFLDQKRRLIIKEALANGRVFPNEKFGQYKEAYHQMSRLSEKYDVGIDAIALRFCIDSIPVYKVLSGATIKEHLDSNLKSNTFELEESDINLLKSMAITPDEYWTERKQLTWN